MGETLLRQSTITIYDWTEALVDVERTRKLKAMVSLLLVLLAIAAAVILMITRPDWLPI